MGEPWSGDEIARITAHARKKFETLDVLETKARRAREEMEAAVRVYSYAKGFRVPLRPESVRREIGA